MYRSNKLGKITKKYVLIGLIGMILSGCTMYPDKYSDQEIFYGDKLIETREIPRAKKVNSSFIYDRDLDEKECEDCPNWLKNWV